MFEISNIFKTDDRGRLWTECFQLDTLPCLIASFKLEPLFKHSGCKHSNISGCQKFKYFRLSKTQIFGWGREELVSAGEGEEDGLAGSVELGDPDLAWGPALPVKLHVWWLGIWFISHCVSFYKLCSSLRPPKLVPSEVLLAEVYPIYFPNRVCFWTRLLGGIFLKYVRMVASTRDEP